MTIENASSGALLQLEHLLRSLLGEGFEEEVRARTEKEQWYRQTLPVAELFQLWVRTKVLGGEEPSWVFDGLRMGDRRRLFQLIALEPNVIARTTSTEHAELVLEAVGLPVKRTRGTRRLMEDWQQVVELSEIGEDERAATLARQRAERFLRKILYFYCATGHGAAFAAVLREPGSLRLPKAFHGAMQESIPRLFVDDGAADLGFLALALRKFSSHIEKLAVRGLSGAPLILLEQREHEALSALATALQPYTHDKPSKQAVRQDDLVTAARATTAVVQGMAARNIVPNDIFVLETCTSLVGRVFRGVTDDGAHMHLVAPTAPPIGKRILCLSTASCSYASSLWTENPWSS